MWICIKLFLQIIVMKEIMIFNWWIVFFYIRYVEEKVQRTGVAIETQGFSIVTSGRKRESLTVSIKVLSSICFFFFAGYYFFLVNLKKKKWDCKKWFYLLVQKIPEISICIKINVSKYLESSFSLKEKSQLYIGFVNFDHQGKLLAKRSDSDLSVYYLSWYKRSYSVWLISWNWSSA